MRFRCAAFAFLLLPMVAMPALSDTPPMTVDIPPKFEATTASADYIRREVMVPMRDGVKLCTVVVMRKGTMHAPILLTRTPYNARKTTSRNPSQTITEILPISDAIFVNDGYIRVYQDVRGRNGSEGEYVMTRPLRGPLNATDTDHATDAYDTIDWLVKNVPETNGRVAITGSSYPGFTSLMALIDPHPALKAAVPMSPMVDGWIGDDFYHNGAFRLGGVDYFPAQSGQKGDGTGVAMGARDYYSEYLAAGSAGDFIRKYGLDQLPFVRKLMEHPTYDAWWQGQAADKLLQARGLSVPTMLVVGQWDQEDSYGAPAVYRALERVAHDRLSLVIGPWRHSGVNYDGSSLGPLKFKGDTALEFRREVMKPFLDHYLKDGAPPYHAPHVLAYETGMDRWQTFDRWPAGDLVPLYLESGFRVGFEKPTGGREAHDDYVSDPAKPVPFVPRPVHISDRSVWGPWLVSDQRATADRTDVLTYTGETLSHTVHIAGQPVVDLWVATSGTDSDFVVKLIDVYPEEMSDQPLLAGYQLPIGIEIFRGRYVDGFDKPRALKPGKAEHLRFNLPAVNHAFLPGHRLMVQVQSSLFPLYDRNPQTFVLNLFEAKSTDYHTAVEQVFRSATQPSAVMLPVVAD